MPEFDGKTDQYDQIYYLEGIQDFGSQQHFWSSWSEWSQ
jgi:hypothetical protein